MLKDKPQRNLDQLLQAAPEMELGAQDKLVVFSDLHVGDGGSGDDFKKNADLFLAALEERYQKDGYTLVLNGDIEELARFPLQSVLDRWQAIYRALAGFAGRGALIKLAGNHDLSLLRRPAAMPFTVGEALKIKVGGGTLFVLHGHQTSRLNWAFQTMGVLFLRWLLRPLRIGNYTVARSSRRRFRVEKRVYEFARRQGLLALIGHTHRPLFESLSRFDALKIEIENLCRRYPRAQAGEKPALAQRLAQLKEEYVELQRQSPHGGGENLYHHGPLLPCLFNSGCGIGRHGITAIEIVAGRMALVYWFDRRRSEKYIDRENFRPQQLGDGDFYRVVLKEEDLDYIFTRVKLLS